jgi:hypothetical protein
VEQPVQTQPIGIEGIGGELAGQLTEFLLNGLRNPYIKDALHQGLDREQMGIDVFQISDRLLHRFSFGGFSWSWS